MLLFSNIENLLILRIFSYNYAFNAFCNFKIQNLVVFKVYQKKICNLQTVNYCSSIPEVCEKDSELYEALSLVETFRIGKVREVDLAYEELKKRL